MININKIEQILTSNHLFSKDEFSLKYKFMLVNSILLAGFFIGFGAGVVRIVTDFYLIAVIDIIFSFSLFALFLSLRKKKTAFNLVSKIALFLTFILATTIVILAKDDQSKLLWFALFIASTFLVKGHKSGTFAYILTIFTLVTLYILPNPEIYLNQKELALAIAAYSCFALFFTFSEMQQEKNINNINLSSKEIKIQKKLIQHQLRTNQLTSLTNSIVLNEDIKNTTKDISYLALDIDDFDIIINEFGENYSEHILLKVAKILQNLTSQSVTLYHVENSKFAFLIVNPTLQQDIKLATVIKSIFENLKVGYREIEITVNFKIAIVREKSSKTISNANITLSDIKSSGENIYTLYKRDKKREQTQKNNIYWAKRLGELMRENNIIVYYQPIVDNHSQKIVKYECLVRAVDKDVIISPYLFLTAAKSKGILKNITKIVIDKSFLEFSQNSYKFSINITEQDLSENYLVDFLTFKTKQYNIDPKRVFLEVLENINSQDSYNANAQFKELKKLGFGLSIDDFGAEASNLSRLLTLKADIIKIDAQFIKNLDTDENSVKIVETIVTLAKKMNTKTIAEFVHNEEIYNIVKKLGVDYSQGYYFSQPLPQVEKEEKNTKFLLKHPSLNH